MLRSILVALLFFCVSASGQTNIDGLYKIYDTRSKKTVAIADVVKAFNEADVLFFGEEHNDSIGHILEAKILEQSHRQMGDKLALSLEMFERDVQLVVDEYLTGLIDEKSLIKDGRAWKNYSDYSPLLNYAKAAKLKVIAANTPARYTSAVVKDGLSVLTRFDIRTREWLPPLPLDTATGKYYNNFMNVMEGHNSTGYLYQAQNLWDATMAWSIFSYIQDKPWVKVFHVNGRFHSDEQLGIIAQLKRYAMRDKKQFRILNISSFSLEDINNADWQKYKELGDFIIVTKKM